MKMHSLKFSRDFFLDFVSVAVKALGGTVQLFAIFFLGKYYSAEVVGYYGYAFSTVALSSTLLCLGYPGYLIMTNSVRYAAHEFSFFIGNIYSSVAVLIKVGLIFQIVLLVLMMGLPEYFENHVAGSILMLSPVFGILMGFVLITSYNLRARRDNILANVIERPLIQIFTLLSFILLYTSVDNVEHAIIISILLSVALIAVVSWKLVFRGLNLSGINLRDVDKPSIKVLFSYFSSVVIDVILARSPIFIGAFFFAVHDLGLFQLAFSIAMSVIVIQEALGGVIASRVAVLSSTGNSQGLLRLHRLSQLMLVLAVSPIVVVLLMWPEEIISFINPEFEAAIYPLQILLVGSMVRCASGVYRSIFEATGAIHYGLYTGLVSVCVLIACITIFQSEGAVGLSLSWAITTIVHAVVGYCFCEYTIRYWVPKNKGLLTP